MFSHLPFSSVSSICTSTQGVPVPTCRAPQAPSPLSRRDAPPATRLDVSRECVYEQMGSRTRVTSPSLCWLGGQEDCFRRGD